MTPLQILGVVALLIAVLASVLCAARLRNWRHPVLLVALCSVVLMPRFLIVEAFEPLRGNDPIDVIRLIDDNYRRLKSGEKQSETSEERRPTTEARAGI